MKTDAMSSNEIEFLSEIGQRSLRIDPRDHPTNTEKLSCAAKERFIVRIKPKAFVAEHAAEIQKITGAAAKIENVQRRRTI